MALGACEETRKSQGVKETTRVQDEAHESTRDRLSSPASPKFFIAPFLQALQGIISAKRSLNPNQDDTALNCIN